MRLQAVGAAFVQWRRAFCIMNLRVTLSGKVKDFRSVAEAKASPNRASSRVK